MTSEGEARVDPVLANEDHSRLDTLSTLYDRTLKRAGLIIPYLGKNKFFLSWVDGGKRRPGMKDMPSRQGEDMSNPRPSGNFALDIMMDTLQDIREHTGNDQWPLPFDEEAVDDIWACDWEDETCGNCGRNYDQHSSRMLTRCAA